MLHIRLGPVSFFIWLGPVSYGRTGPRARRSRRQVARSGDRPQPSNFYCSGRSPDRARRSHVDRWRGRETGHSNDETSHSNNETGRSTHHN